MDSSLFLSAEAQIPAVITRIIAGPQSCHSSSCVHVKRAEDIEKERND